MGFPVQALAQESDVAASAQEASIATASATSWSTCGTCEWRIDDDGCLTIRPAGDATEGTLASWSNADEAPWYSSRTDVASVRFDGTIHVSTAFAMFYGMSNLSSIDFTGLDTSSATSMKSMLNGCTSLKSVDLSGLVTSNVTLMSYMFSGCSALTSLDLSTFDVSCVTGMSYMFSGCSALSSIKFGNFNVSKVTTMSHMFDGCGLTSIDLSPFGPYTWSVTDMSYMFANCTKLKTLDLSPLDTSCVTDMSYMFSGCSSVSSIDFTDFYTAKVLSMAYMFSGCKSIKELDLTSFNTRKLNIQGGAAGLFANCSALEKIDISSFYSNANSGSSYGYASYCSTPAQNTAQNSNPSRVNIFYGCTSLTEVRVGAQFKGYGSTLYSSFYLLRQSKNNSNGKWVNQAGTVYSYDSIPEYTAATYYSQAKLNFLQFEVDTTDAAYTGSPIKGRVSSSTYVEGEDYKVTYSHNTQVGTASVTITGLKAYGGQSQSYEFNIVKGDPSYEAPTAINTLVGKTLGDLTLPSGFTWQDDTTTVVSVGEHEYLATYTPDDTDNFNVVKDIPVKVCATGEIDASLFSIDSAALTYDGTAHEPAVTSADLPDGSYTVEYRNNTNAGTATAVVTAAAPYSGTVELSFEIAPAKVKLESASRTFTYNGSAQSDAAVTATGAASLFQSQVSDLKATGSVTNVSDGAVSNAISYSWKDGCSAANFDIELAPGTLSVAAKSIVPTSTSGTTVSVPADAVYDGEQHKWAPEVKSGGAALSQGADYTVSYSTDNFVDAGSVTVTITGAGNYTGTVTRSYSITKRPVTLASESHTFTYNGQDQTWDKFTCSDDLFASQVSGMGCKVAVKNSGDSKKNVVSYTFASGYSAANYQITESFGTLTVKDSSDQIVAMATGGTFVYDGTEHTAKVEVSGLPEGYTVSAAASSASATDVTYSAGVACSVDTLVIRNAAGNDVTANLNIKRVSDVIKVTAAPLTVTTSGATKVYDGSALSAKGTMSGLVAGETATFKVTGSQAAAGSSLNAYKITWDGTAKASNYVINEKLGTLRVLAQSIDPDSVSYSGVSVGQIADVAYTGSEQKVSPTVVSSGLISLVEGTDYSVAFTGDDFVNAGNTVTATVEGKGNYTGTVERTYSIVKATPFYEAPGVLAAAYGQTLSDVALPAGFTWQDDAATAVGEPGEHTFLATFTPSDAANYNVVADIPVTVRVTRSIDASMFSLAATEFTFGGGSYEPSVSSSVVPQGSYSVDYRDNVAAGKATAVVTGSGFYTGTAELEFTISKADPVYAAPVGLTATYGQTLGDVFLPAGFSWQDGASTSVGAAGVHTFKATYTPSDTANYNVVRDIDVTVTVGAKAIDNSMFSVVTDGLVYTGGALEPVVTSAALSAGLDYDVAYSDNVNAGTGIVTITGKGNYRGTVTTQFAIAKAEPAYSAPADLAATYGQTLVEVSLPAGFAWQDDGSTSVGAVGTHSFKATYTPSDTANYNVVRDIEVGVRVGSASLNGSMFSVDTSAQVYTGDAIEPAVSSALLASGVDYDVAYQSNVNAGTAAIVVTGKGNYSGTLRYSFEILKTTPVFAAPTGLTASYGQTLGDVALPEGFSWQDEASTSVGAAGEHTFKVTYTPADTANYEVVRDIDVTVAVSPAKVAAPVAVTGLVYDGRAQTGVAPDAQGLYAVEGGVRTAVGSYVATAKLADPANYVWEDGMTADKQVSWSIAKAVPAYEAPTNLTATYGQTLADVALPAGFAWQDSAATSVGAIGANSFLVTYTPADTANYEIVRDIAVAVKVSAAPQSVYRLYNSITSEHLFTTSFDEYNSLTAYDWQQEGVSWNSPTAGKGVYRVYNPALGAMGKMSHHYTTDYSEAAGLVANHGWQWDNGGQPIFYSAEDESGNVLEGADPVYRLYNGGLSSHHFTLNSEENDQLIAKYGWKGEGVGFYAFSAAGSSVK